MPQRSTISEMILARAAVEAEWLREGAGQLAEALKARDCQKALDHLCKFQLRAGHIGTITALLRDWEEANDKLNQKEDNSGKPTVVRASAASSHG